MFRLLRPGLEADLFPPAGVVTFNGWFSPVRALVPVGRAAAGTAALAAPSASLPAAGDAPCRAPSCPPCDPAWSEHR